MAWLLRPEIISGKSAIFNSMVVVLIFSKIFSKSLLFVTSMRRAVTAWLCGVSFSAINQCLEVIISGRIANIAVNINITKPVGLFGFRQGRFKNNDQSAALLHFSFSFPKVLAILDSLF
jgi:hypothetical protein